MDKQDDNTQRKVENTGGRNCRMSVDFQQKDVTEVVGWLGMTWDKGANTILITGTEMRQIPGILEQHAVNTAFLELTHRGHIERSHCRTG